MKNRITQQNIPSGWKLVTLGDLFEFKNGLNSEKENFGHGIRFINIMEILKHDFLVAENIPGRINVNPKRNEENLVEYGDVLFNRTSETPKEVGMTSVYLDTEPVVFGGFVIRAKSKSNELNDLFKKYCFSSTNFRKEVIKNSQGVVRGNIGQNNLRKISFLLPPRKEQDNIVSILETWSQAIEKLKRKIEIKEEVKKGLMQKLLIGKIRLPGFKGTLKEIQFGDLFDERSERGALGLPLLSITSDKGVIYQSDSNKKDTSNSDKSKYLRIRPGDIGYNTMRMWQGRSAISSMDGLVSPAYTILTPKENVDSRYFAYLFKMPRIVNFFFQKSQGLVSDTLQCRYRDFSIVKYPVPDFDEQTAVADLLTSADREIIGLEQKLAILTDQKKYLLNNLITGAIRPSESLPILK